MGQLVSSARPRKCFSILHLPGTLKNIRTRLTWAWNTHGAFSGGSGGACRRQAIAPAATGGRARLRRKRSLARSLARDFHGLLCGACVSNTGFGAPGEAGKRTLNHSAFAAAVGGLRFTSRSRGWWGGSGAEGTTAEQVPGRTNLMLMQNQNKTNPPS